MFDKLKFAALAAGLTLLPMSASALTFFPRSLDPSQTYLVSADHTDGIEDGIFGQTTGDVAGLYTYDFTITNDTAFGQTVLFDRLYANVSNLTFSLSNFVAGAVDDFTATLAAGQSETFTLSYQNVAGEQDKGLNVSIALVPVPAAGLLILTALGGLVALRRRKTDLTAA